MSDKAPNQARPEGFLLSIGLTDAHATDADLRSRPNLDHQNNVGYNAIILTAAARPSNLTDIPLPLQVKASRSDQD